MRPYRVSLLLLLAGLLVVSFYCANKAVAAKNITGQMLDKIELFGTKKAEVIKIFGPPDKTETIGGEETLVYQTKVDDPVRKTKVCNILTVTIGKDGWVNNFVYKEYCELK